MSSLASNISGIELESNNGNDNALVSLEWSDVTSLNEWVYCGMALWAICCSVSGMCPLHQILTMRISAQSSFV